MCLGSSIHHTFGFRASSWLDNLCGRKAQEEQSAKPVVFFDSDVDFSDGPNLCFLYSAGVLRLGHFLARC